MKPEEISQIVNALTSAQWAAFFAALTGSVLSILVVALVSYLREKGKHFATRENFEEILQQKIATREAMQTADLRALEENIVLKLRVVQSEVAASRDAEFQVIQQHLSDIKAQEEAKKAGEMEAVDKNLQKLIKQVEAVTSKTEEIKQDMANEIWMRQAVRKEKGAIYESIARIPGGVCEQIATGRRISW
jgi:hypothetical protein